jgi:hypothetical protein
LMIQNNAVTAGTLLSPATTTPLADPVPSPTESVELIGDDGFIGCLRW